MDFKQRLWCRDDLHERAVAEIERVAQCHVGGFGQVDHEFVVAISGDQHAAALARLPVEGDAVHRDAATERGATDQAGGAAHVVLHSRLRLPPVGARR